MEKKFYILFLLITFSGLFKARAQNGVVCTAQFTVSDSSGNQVSFRAADSISGTQQFWSFGDGSQLQGFGNYVGVTHTYAHTGTYTVIHVVKNAAASCQDSSTQVINLPSPLSQCVIDIYFTQNSSANNSPYTFYAIPYLAGATQDTVSWTIDGALAGTGDTLTRFLQPGRHNICTSLSTNLGCRSQSCQTILVTDSASTPPVISPPDTGITVPPNIPPDTSIIIISPNLPPDSSASFLSSYPNPVSGQVHMELKTDKAQMIYIRVYNSMGGMVQTVVVSGIQGTNQLSLNVSSLQSGIYYIQIQYGNEIKRSRIQKL